jgi:hypothetical protein
MNKAGHWKIVVLVICLTSLVFTEGCSSFSAREQRMVSFIKPGVTTKAEVLENLGEPIWQQEGAVAYLWNPSWSAHPRHRGADYYAQHPEYAGYHRGGRDAVDHEYSVFCIAFDAEGRVSRSEILDTDSGATNEAVTSWFQRNVPAK